MEVTLKLSTGSTSGVRLAAGNGHEIEIGYDMAKQAVYIDRSKTSNQGFHANFEKLNRFESKLPLTNNTLQLHIFFDHSIVEVFANGGETALTAQLFPDQKDDGIELFSTKGTATLLSLSLWKLKSIW